MKQQPTLPRRAAWIVAGSAAGLAVVAAPQGASAQRGNAARAAYTMVAGRVQGSNEQVVYVLDGANQELAAFRWNTSDKVLEPSGYRDVRDDAERGVGGGR